MDKTDLGQFLWPDVGQGRQPRSIPSIDWSNPITRHLEFCAFPVGSTFIDLVTGVPGTNTGALVPANRPTGNGLSSCGDGLSIAATGTSTDEVIWPASLARGGSVTTTGTVLALGGTTEQVDGKLYIFGGNSENVTAGDGFTLAVDSFSYINRGNILRCNYHGSPLGYSTPAMVGNPFGNKTNFFGYSFNSTGANGTWLAGRAGSTWSGETPFGTTTTNRRAILHAASSGFTGNAKNAYILLFLIFSREISLAEYQTLYDNPWLLLAPPALGLDICVSTSVSATANGTTLSDTVSISTAGTASGTASVSGQTLSDTASIATAGAASGGASVSGQTLSDTASIATAGAASGTASVSGQTLSDTASISTAGAASGDASVSGQTISDTASMSTAGTASGTASVSGQTLSDTASIATAGVASGTASVSGQTLSDTVSLATIGAAAGAGTSSGQTVAVISSLISGFASGGNIAVGATLPVTCSLVTGIASGSCQVSGQEIDVIVSLISGTVQVSASTQASLLQVVSSLFPGTGSAITAASINTTLDDNLASIYAYNQSETEIQTNTFEVIFSGSAVGYRGSVPGSEVKIGIENKITAVSTPDSPIYTNKYETKTIPDLPGSVPLNMGIVKAPPSSPPK